MIEMFSSKNWRPNGCQALLLICSFTLFSDGVECYGEGRWGQQAPTSSAPGTSLNSGLTTQRPPSSVPTLEPQELSFQPPRYQFPGGVTQPPPGSTPSTPSLPPRLPGGSNPAPPLRGRPTRRYSPQSSSSTDYQGNGGWTSSQVSPPEPSLNDTLNPYRHSVSLDPQGRYNLTWVYDWSRNLTIFNVTARTTGWVGFGLARRVTTKMTGADLIVGGVYPNGTSYFSDRYAIENQLPLIDPSQDWIIYDSWERNGLTYLSFSRALDTCDPLHDIPITDDSIRLLWAFGETDEIKSHFGNRGRYDGQLLNPDLTPLEVLNKQRVNDPYSSLKVFNMTSTLEMPARTTTYWCNWFKAPTTTKHHIIGFDTIFPSESDIRHIHHLNVRRCYAPPGIDPDLLFGPVAESSGGECYFAEYSQQEKYCRETTSMWAVGGRAFFLPDHVGVPLSERGTEYHMIQVHYNNPENLVGLNITFTYQAFYTEELREHDASVLGLATQVPSAMSIVIPPYSTNHVTNGLCPSSCIEQGLNGQEVNIVAGKLHTHTTGVAARIMHIRGNRELPWIVSDDNWNFDFQHFQLLHEERRLLPGDMLLQRCEYDSTARNGSAVTGGFGTNEAMCTGNMYYYPRQLGFTECRGLTRDESYWDFLGVRNATWDTANRQVIITDPPNVAGLTMVEHLNRNIEWNEEFRRELQRRQLFGPQVTQCGNSTVVGEMSMDEFNEYLSGGRLPALPQQPNSLHPSQLPRSLLRYRRPLQCNANSRNPIMDRVDGIRSN